VNRKNSLITQDALSLDAVLKWGCSLQATPSKVRADLLPNVKSLLSLDFAAIYNS
jgi:hypothetical protein